jgi:hypothetical protein
VSHHARPSFRAAEPDLQRARPRRRLDSRDRVGLVLVAWYLLVSSCALYDAIDAVEQLSPRATAARVAAPGFRCAHHACGCTDAEACRRHCCCEDEPASPRPDAARPDGTIHLLRALACHGGSNGGLALVPLADPAVLAFDPIVIPPRIPAALVVLASSHVPALDGRAPDKVPIALA